MRLLLFVGFLSSIFVTIASAQDLRVATVTRPPFSMVEDETDTGFSLDLWDALMKDLDQSYEVVRVESFSEMLRMVAEREVDAAVANISITSAREQILDFTQPIFSAGLQIMSPKSGGSTDISVWKAIFSRDLMIAVAAAFALLFGGGMLMWRMERNAQPYFDKPAKEAMFPAFWWALNLVVNGGFEERMPRTFFGRIFGVFLVISSLFIVSIFVAKITSVMTVEAIQSNVGTVNDLYGKRVATTAGSTAAAYLDARDIQYQGFDGLEPMLADFEDGKLDAIVFDAPVLAYYANTRGVETARMVGPVFLRESYGIAVPSNSDLAEPINQSLLKLRENGTYDLLNRKWFGQSR